MTFFRKRPFQILALIALGFPVTAQETTSQLPKDQAVIVLRTLENSTDQVVRVKTFGGGEFQGTLLTVDENRTEILDGEGLILQIATAEIEDILLIDVTKGAITYYQDAAANKLIVAPLGFPMESGEFHVSDQEIIAVNVSYGLNEHFSLWGGLSIPGMLINFRGSFEPRESIGVSVGALSVITFVDFSAILLPYVISSFGTENQNLTIGAGIPFVVGGIVDGDFSLGGAFVVGGKIVISKTASLITENWVLFFWNYNSFDSSDSFGWARFTLFPSIAIRIAGSRFSWDIGITMPVGVSTDREFVNFCRRTFF